MKWLEVLEVRAAKIDNSLLNKQIAHLLVETQMNQSIKIYINIRSGTDWCIHLLHESEQVEMRGSDLAMQFKEILRKFGILNYSIWGEQTIQVKKEKNKK